MDELHIKYKKLQDILSEMESVLVAFSGGVDSTFLLKVAHDTLGDSACAVTASSPTYPASEFREAADLARSFGVLQIVIESNELDIPGFSANPEDRCYHCKKELFRLCIEKACTEVFAFIVDQSG